MTREELQIRMKILEARAKVLVIQQAPVKTGNLVRSIKTESLPNGGFRIYIDQGQAPYAKYTNNPWQKGKNPNEHWFKDAGRMVARAASSTLASKLIQK